MTTTKAKKNEDTEVILDQQNKQLAPICARWLHAFIECSNEVQEVAVSMISIMADPEVDADDKEMACETLIEALFPDSSESDVEGMEAEYADAPELAELDQQEQTFSERLAELLEERSMTQTQLANMLGVNQSAVSMMLKRKARPQRLTVQKIAEALKVDPAELWGEV